MNDKNLKLEKIQTDLEESECRIMSSERKLHMIYTGFKASLPWSEGDFGADHSHEEMFGLPGGELALIHRFMFAGAFESARIKSLEGPEASAQKSAELFETVQSVGYPAHEILNNYSKYENRFAKELHRLDHPDQSARAKAWCRIRIVGPVLLLIILVTIFFLNK